jgi:hypothetical protein
MITVPCELCVGWLPETIGLIHAIDRHSNSISDVRVHEKNWILGYLAFEIADDRRQFHALNRREGFAL